MIIIITMGLQSQEKDSYQDKVDNIVITFQMQKINYNGIDGWFIPFAGYKQLRLTLNDYVYCQDLIIIKDERIKQLERFEIINFRLKTALAITISFDVGTTLIAVGLGLLTYNLAIQ
jgi:hypothetical protein